MYYVTWQTGLKIEMELRWLISRLHSEILLDYPSGLYIITWILTIRELVMAQVRVRERCDSGRRVSKMQRCWL